MRIAEIRVIQARIPLRKRISHASFSRSENETILVRCQLDNGITGWGESLPRPYVTGETAASTWQQLNDYPYSTLGAEFASLESLGDLAATISFPQVPGQRDCFGNAARCALELALLDAGCRSLGKPISDFLRQHPAASGLCRPAFPVHYSAVLTASSLPKTCLRSSLYRLFGFHQCKVKVGQPGIKDSTRLTWIRRLLGAQVELRIDANEAWCLDQAIRQLSALSSIPLKSVEQPLPHTAAGSLNRLRREISIPVMLDESLCSLKDANQAIAEQWCDSFNLRISKCGGLIACTQLLQQAHAAGISCQLGCQVGETGILSAAGRHFACTFTGLTAVEGSFDRLLVREPLTQEDLTFGWGGEGQPLKGAGLGIQVKEQNVARVTINAATHQIR